ncbi:MAG: hypothetical protein AAGF12_26225 [Myxococcota bacterium]
MEGRLNRGLISLGFALEGTTPVSGQTLAGYGEVEMRWYVEGVLKSASEDELVLERDGDPCRLVGLWPDAIDFGPLVGSELALTLRLTLPDTSSRGPTTDLRVTHREFPLLWARDGSLPRKAWTGILPDTAAGALVVPEVLGPEGEPAGTTPRRRIPDGTGARIGSTFIGAIRVEDTNAAFFVVF